jgi:hypothetical protein
MSLYGIYDYISTMKQGTNERMFLRNVEEGTNRGDGLKKPYKPKEYRKQVFKVGKLLKGNKIVRIEHYKELSFIAVERQFKRSARKEERRQKFARLRQK